MQLTHDDLRRFAEDGYLVMRDVVPAALLDAADVEIEKLMGERAPDEGNRAPGN